MAIPVTLRVLYVAIIFLATGSTSRFFANPAGLGIYVLVIQCGRRCSDVLSMGQSEGDWHAAAAGYRRAGDLSGADALEQSALARLFDADAVRCVVQPLVRLSDEKVYGYEALSRIDDPAVSLDPGRWLELAARHGRREELELHMLRKAAALGQPPGGGRLFVNASASTLLLADFDAVRSLLPEHVIEVTEHDPVRDYAELLPRLARFRAEGSLIAVDDVGSGYSTMAHVLELDPAYLKIDRSIVSGIDRDPRRRALVAALHTLAAQSGALSIAEGVERPEELAVLRSVGVDLAQGYLLCRPGPAWPQLLLPDGSTTGNGESSLWPRISAAKNAREAAHHVTAHLARDPNLLPSIYLARGERLRCIARFGQWLVMDGIPAGLGLTGAAWVEGRTLLVDNVTDDPRYRQAVPGVCSEIAIPLHVGGDVVGVLNVDALRSLAPADVARITSAAGVLEARLRTVGCGPEADSILQRLGRSASQLARAASAEELGHVATVDSTRLTGFDSACLWLAEDGRYASVASCGPDGSVLAALDQDALQDLRDLVQEMAACYTTGPALDLGSAATDMLKRAGVRALVAVPIRDGSQLLGMLVITRRHGAVTAPDAVEVAELICQHAASRLAALRRVAELEALATRDILTGLGNRGRLDLLLADPTTCQQARWLAAIDIDRFKYVNDTHGHAVGDEVLRAVGRALTAIPGHCDVLRLGGDEFAVLLTPLEEAAAAAGCEQILEETGPILQPYGAGLSIGLASTEGPEGMEGALIKADKALYERKAIGGGGVTLWRPAAPVPRALIPAPATTASYSARSQAPSH